MVLAEVQQQHSTGNNGYNYSWNTRAFTALPRFKLGKAVGFLPCRGYV